MPEPFDTVDEGMTSSYFREAFLLEEARLKLLYLVSLARPINGMSDDQLMQRNAIMELAARIIKSERDTAMDLALHYWQQHRKGEDVATATNAS